MGNYFSIITNLGRVGSLLIINSGVKNGFKKKDIAWENAKTVRGRNPNLWRRDDFGNLIYKPAYRTNGEYGWEVDHKNPVSRGGSDRADNLRALNTKNNRVKGKKYPFKH